jgi:hypothetical protein
MAEVSEKILWYYDEIMRSKGNRVVITALHNDGATSKLVDKDNNPPKYAPRLSKLTAKEEKGEVFTTSEYNKFKELYLSGPIHEKIVNKTTVTENGVNWNGGSNGLTEEEYNNLPGDYQKYFAPLGGYKNYTYVTDTTNADQSQESLIVSMSELSIGINNQWTEGNGANGIFNGGIDAAAQLGTDRATASVLNELDRFGLGENETVKSLKKMNQIHYRASTQFMKAYAGTNISIPISVTRTFVHDRYNITHDTDIAKMAKWALGTEMDIGDYTDTNDLMKKLKTSARDYIGDTMANTIGNYTNDSGGVYQKAPLGYIYSSQFWRKMMEDDSKNIPGTLVVTLPNGIQIPDLLVSDMSIVMSNTQVLTKLGLRPLTITISVQLLPARVWGVKDALKILGYKGKSLNPDGTILNVSFVDSNGISTTNVPNTNREGVDPVTQTQTASNGEAAAKKAQQNKANNSNAKAPVDYNPTTPPPLIARDTRNYDINFKNTLKPIPVDKWNPNYPEKDN